MVETDVKSVYGKEVVLKKQNRSYFGNTAMVSNETDLDSILYAAENTPEDRPVIVIVRADKPMVFSEFENEVDAILVGFQISDSALFEMVLGNYEPSGLLPIQMPLNMDEVEKQYEDVPRDMECYVDSEGNTYDFAYGLNWSGVISDERTEKYSVAPIKTP
jgi:beta-glucosidase